MNVLFFVVLQLPIVILIGISMLFMSLIMPSSKSLTVLYRRLQVQWTPSNPATLGTCQSVLISIFGDILKWPEYRGGVQIRGSSL